MSSHRFDARPDSVPAARHFVRRELGELGEPTAVAEVLVSELASNVVLHARTDFTVTVERQDGRLRIVVEDGVAVDAGSVDLLDEVESGRGMAVMEGLSDRWGVNPFAEGKQVWFELGLQREDASRPKAP